MYKIYVRLLLIPITICLALTAAGAESITLSTHCKNGDYLKKVYEHNENRDDISPGFQWKYAGKAKFFAITCHDPDMGEEDFGNWIIYNIPEYFRSISSGVQHMLYVSLREKESDPYVREQINAMQGINGLGGEGYCGPFNPVGDPEHRLVFTIYALDSFIKDKKVTLEGFRRAITGHVLASSCITLKYHPVISR